ncbi:aspartate/glutamate racemase family protein, partial [Pseudomonas sp. GW460-13]
GMKRFCNNVRACDLPVLELERPGSDARRIITEACRQALVEDRSECIVLGCAGMTDLCDEIADAIGAPVIDGVVCAVKMAEALVSV